MDALFLANRHRLMTQASCNAIRAYNLSTDVIHNDTTTLSLSGAYEKLDNQGSVEPKRAYNKDNRPGAKQIVFNLNMLGDGHIPILANFHDGNTADSDTHKVNWDVLKAHLKRSDFLYISDSKGARIENMGHIAQNKGKFISVLPGTRKEVQDFLSDLSTAKKPVDWQVVLRKTDSRDKQKQVLYEAYSEQKTKEGYTLHWIRSSAKAQKEAQSRQNRLLRLEQDLAQLNPKLNQYYLKERAQIEAAVDKIRQGTQDLIDVQIIEHQHTKLVKIGRGSDR